MPISIICDDAHAGEELIAGLWSLHVARGNHPSLFQGLVDLLGDAIAPEMRRRIGSEDPYDHTEGESSRSYAVSRPPRVTHPCLPTNTC